MDKSLKFPKSLPLPSPEALESGPAAPPGSCHSPSEAGGAALLIPDSGEMERAFNYLSQRLIPPSRHPGEVGQPASRTGSTAKDPALRLPQRHRQDPVSDSPSAPGLEKLCWLGREPGRAPGIHPLRWERCPRPDNGAA